MDLPKPEPTELSRPFWDALRDGHLVFQRCGCGHAFLPARDPADGRQSNEYHDQSGEY